MRSGAFGVRAALVLCGLVALWFASDAVLESSSAFWSFGDADAPGAAAESYRVEGQARRLAEREGGSDLVLVMGSSLVESNVDVSELARGMSVAEDSIVPLWMSAAAELEMAMLTPLLEATPPKIVVYVTHVWAMHARTNVDRPRLYDPGVALELLGARSALARPARHAAQMILGSHVALRHRSAFLDLIPVERKAETLAMLRERWTDAAISTPLDFGCHSENMEALDLLARRLAAAGVAVWIVPAPLQDEWGSEPSLRRLLDRCLSDAAHAGGYRHVPSAALASLEPGHFRDKLHLNASGRALFTHVVIDAVSRLD